MNKMVLVLSLSLLGASVASAGTNTLTYAATLGRVVDGAVVRYPLTGEVELTLTLYPSDAADAEALWSHRFATPVCDGDFVAEISDAVGMRDATCPSAKYARLDQLFRSEPVNGALWVGISNVTRDGVPLSAAATGALQRGKITGVPYAVVAQRAVSARGNFTVRGKATVSVLQTVGRLQVDGNATFGSSASFYGPAVFGSDDVTVTGTVRKTTLDGVGTLQAESVVVSESVTANVLAVTNGAATTLTPASGALANLKEAAVTGALEPADETTVSGGLSAKKTVSVTGDLVLDTSKVIWRDGGALSVPNGVYEPGYKLQKDVRSTGSFSWKNESGRNALATLSAGTTEKNEIMVNGRTWATACGAAVNVSMLVPLRAGEELKASKGAINAFMKELSK